MRNLRRDASEPDGGPGSYAGRVTVCERRRKAKMKKDVLGTSVKLRARGRSENNKIKVLTVDETPTKSLSKANIKLKKEKIGKDITISPELSGDT